MRAFGAGLGAREPFTFGARGVFDTLAVAADVTDGVTDADTGDMDIVAEIDGVADGLHIRHSGYSTFVHAPSI